MSKAVFYVGIIITIVGGVLLGVSFGFLTAANSATVQYNSECGSLDGELKQLSDPSFASHCDDLKATSVSNAGLYLSTVCGGIIVLIVGIIILIAGFIMMRKAKKAQTYQAPPQYQPPPPAQQPYGQPPQQQPYGAPPPQQQQPGYGPPPAGPSTPPPPNCPGCGAPLEGRPVCGSCGRQV